MSNKVLLVLLCGACGAIGWLMRESDSGQAFAQVSAETAQGRYYLVKGRVASDAGDNSLITQTFYYVFDSDTGDLSITTLGGEVVAFIPATPFQLTPDGKGNVYLHNPDSGSVWKIDKKGNRTGISKAIRNSVVNGEVNNDGAVKE